jgi:uncharacterized BrkB/YihY/UPF0761 family membrane protein
MKKKRAAAVVAIWGVGNGLLTVALMLWGGPSLVQRSWMFGAATLIVGLTALLVLTLRARYEPPVRRPPPSGAPAVALAGAFLVGGLAWVFGSYLAYLAIPLLTYSAMKWVADIGAPEETP